MPGTANSIITPQTPKSVAVVTTAAETAYHNPTAVVKLLTAGPNGARLTRLRSRPRATVAATALHLYLSLDAGVTKTLIDSAAVTAHTVQPTTKIPETDWLYSDVNPLILAPSAELWLSQTVLLANGISHEAEWADY